MRILFSIFVLCGLTGCWSQPRTGSATAKSNSSPQYQSPMESENTSTQAVSKPTPTTTSDSKSPKLKPTLRSLDEMLLFQPSKYPQGDWEPAGLDYEDVWFNSADSTKLHAWYCPSEKPIAVILFAHGNGGHLAHRGLAQVSADRIECFCDDVRLSWIRSKRGCADGEGSIRRCASRKSNSG